jgi:predicted amidohydrolase
MYRKRRTEDEWQTLFEAQAISTLSPPAFCKQNNIHLNTFYARRSSISSWEKYWVLSIAHLPHISLKKQATTNRRHKRVRSH